MYKISRKFNTSYSVVEILPCFSISIFQSWFLTISPCRSQFQRALSEQVLYLTQLLSPSLLLLCHAPHHTNKRHLLLLFDLIYSVLNPEEEKQDGHPSSSPSSPVVVHLSSQSLCRVLQALLSHYFSMMKMAALSILKSETLFINCTHATVDLG